MKFENNNIFKTVLALYKRNFFMEIQVLNSFVYLFSQVYFQDFDCYLDNFANDWTNRGLHELILLVGSENEGTSSQ